MQFDIVAALDAARGIGQAGTIPWKLPTDMALFKRMTSRVHNSDAKNAVIMGRKTWESIPERFRPLPNRANFIITRNDQYGLGGVVPFAFRVGSLTEALELAEKLEYIERAFVIGGAEIYAEAIQMPECKQLYLTQLQETLPCDVFFPEYSDFKLSSESYTIFENEHTFTFQTWERDAA